MAWLKAKPQIQGALLADFDSQWTDPHVATFGDTADTLSATQIAGAAEVVARTAFAVATGSPPELLLVRLHRSAAVPIQTTHCMQLTTTACAARAALGLDNILSHALQATGTCTHAAAAASLDGMISLSLSLGCKRGVIR